MKSSSTSWILFILEYSQLFRPKPRNRPWLQSSHTEHSSISKSCLFNFQNAQRVWSLLTNIISSPLVWATGISPVAYGLSLLTGRPSSALTSCICFLRVSEQGTTTKWLETIEMYWFTVLKAWSPKSRCPQSQAQRLWTGSLLCPFLAKRGSLQSLAFLDEPASITPVSACVLAWSSPCGCVHISFFL